MEPDARIDDPEIDNPTCWKPDHRPQTRRNESEADRVERYIEAFSHSDRPDRPTYLIPERLSLEYIEKLHASHQLDLGIGPEENIRFADPRSNMPVQRWIEAEPLGPDNHDYICFDGETIESFYLPRRVFKELTPQLLDENPAYVKVNEYLRPIDGTRRVSPRIQCDETNPVVSDCERPKGDEDRHG